jgi:hypothetical protein
MILKIGFFPLSLAPNNIQINLPALGCLSDQIYQNLGRVSHQAGAQVDKQAVLPHGLELLGIA